MAKYLKIKDRKKVAMALLELMEKFKLEECFSLEIANNESIGLQLIIYEEDPSD